jgi:hypothetical protein
MPFTLPLPPSDLAHVSPRHLPLFLSFSIRYPSHAQHAPRSPACHSFLVYLIFSTCRKPPLPLRSWDTTPNSALVQIVLSWCVHSFPLGSLRRLHRVREQPKPWKKLQHLSIIMADSEPATPFIPPRPDFGSPSGNSPAILPPVIPMSPSQSQVSVATPNRYYQSSPTSNTASSLRPHLLRA